MGSISTSREYIENQTFLDFGANRLQRLCRAVGLEDQERRILEDFGAFSRPWNRWRIGDRPRWYPSILSDDHAPFELSAGFASGETELQCYWEAQGERPSLRSNMETGRDVLEELARTHGLSLERWRSIEDLFMPAQPSGLFTILFAASWAPRRATKFKIYLNPHVRGSRETPALMREAMTRLGFQRAWAAECEQRAQRAQRDELGYVCLDLTTGPEARVKVYRRHYGATVTELAALAGIARDYRPGMAERFYGLVAGRQGPFTAKPPITSLSFRQGDDERPGSVTLEFPISSYVGDDQEASERVARCLAAYGLDSSRYWEAVDAIATRPLDRGNGIHAHVTHRVLDGAPRLAVYFATEAYLAEALKWPAEPQSVRSPASLRQPAVEVPGRGPDSRRHFPPSVP